MAASDDDVLTLAQLARYLHLSEKTVTQLVDSGEIPGVKLGSEWRFQRAAVRDWLAAQATQAEAQLDGVADPAELPLGELLTQDGIIVDLRARDRLGVIEELAALAWRRNWLTDKPWFIGQLVEREALASTAMEGGVAFLHTRARHSEKIARPFIIVGRSWEGIDFGGPDGETFLFFLLGLKHDRIHLPVLGRLARITKNPATVAKLRATTSVAKMRSLLLSEDQKAIEGKLVVQGDGKKPTMDLDLRRRTIMQLARARKVDEAKKKKAAAAKKKAAATRAKKKTAAEEKKKAAAAKKKAAAAKKKKAVAAKKPTVRKKST